MPLLVMLPVGVMSADGHEKGVFRQVDISAELKGYYKSRELLMVRRIRSTHCHHRYNSGLGRTLAVAVSRAERDNAELRNIHLKHLFNVQLH